MVLSNRDEGEGLGKGDAWSEVLWWTKKLWCRGIKVAGEIYSPLRMLASGMRMGIVT